MQFIGDIRTDGVTAILQLGMNIVLFVPMGFFLARFFRLPSWVAVAVCCATSVCIEVAQLTGIFHLYPCAYRICDVDDVITNTLGGAVGVALGLWCNRAFPAPRINKTEVTMHPGFLRRCVSFAVDMGIVSMCQMLSIVLGRISGMEQSPLKAARSLCCSACGSCCSKALCHGVPMDAPSAASSPG
ncbi:VanZ family protein [Bifidobacterium pseudolongum]|uniref:VanZ family protein n=1 Tax=Bifidobacterium pseudolongum TaxID=1694 RepID=UPI000CB26376|nr:VanZ family protein [Bifidobacterium pseudolongum]PKU99894.1 teicoplanin resistance protein VanZ [Bifidobacterium pseudolongum subsp. globosum]